MQAKKRQDKDIEIKNLHSSLRMPGDPENQAPESPQTASSSTQQSAVLIPRSGLPPFPPFDPLSNIHVQYSHLLAGSTGGYTCHKWFEKYSQLLAGATGG